MKVKHNFLRSGHMAHGKIVIFSGILALCCDANEGSVSNAVQCNYTDVVVAVVGEMEIFYLKTCFFLEH